VSCAVWSTAFVGAPAKPRILLEETPQFLQILLAPRKVEHLKVSCAVWSTAFVGTSADVAAFDGASACAAGNFIRSAMSRSVSVPAGWHPMGAAVAGEAPGDRSGRAVALSADGARLAIGAPGAAGGAAGPASAASALSSGTPAAASRAAAAGSRWAARSTAQRGANELRGDVHFKVCTRVLLHRAPLSPLPDPFIPMPQLVDDAARWEARGSTGLAWRPTADVYVISLFAPTTMTDGATPCEKAASSRGVPPEGRLSNRAFCADLPCWTVCVATCVSTLAQMAT